MDGLEEAAASALATPELEAATSVRKNRLDENWEPALDAGASTCVSGSEGSLPRSSQEVNQKASHQQQPVKQQLSQDLRKTEPQRDTEMSSKGVAVPCSDEFTVYQSSRPTQQHFQQQNCLILEQSSAAVNTPRYAHAHAPRSSDTGDCGDSLPVAASSTLVVAPQVQKGSRSSSFCNSSSIGGELKGLVMALSASDTAAGSDELQHLLQQLLAERDLYKAAFGAAKEELKNLECRQQQLTQALQSAEQEQVHQQPIAENEASGPQHLALQWDSNSNCGMQQQLVDSSGTPLANTCDNAEGPFKWLHRLYSCVASKTYPPPDLLRKGVEQQQQLIRLAEGLQREREGYVEAVASLQSQLREARQDVSLFICAHATQAADLTAESDEALKAADLWLQYALRSGSKCKLWGFGSVVHSQEAAAASAAKKSTIPAVRACSNGVHSEACTTAAAAALIASEEPPPGVSVALAAAASVFGVQDDSVGDHSFSSGTAAAAAGGPAAPTELERLWWGQSSGVFLEKQQLQMQRQQREGSSRILWFLE